MDPFDAVLAVFATWQAVEIWRHSALTADWRDACAVRAAWWARMLSCPWCLSVWTAGIAAAAAELSHGTDWHRLYRWIAGALAVSRAANVLNDLTWPGRTPKDSGIELDHAALGGDGESAFAEEGP